MDTVDVYARPYNFEVKSDDGKSTFVANPNFDPELVPHIIIPKDVAQESIFIMDLIEDLSESGKAPLVQVDNVTHDDLEKTFQVMQIIKDVLGVYVLPGRRIINAKGEYEETSKSNIRERPYNANLNDEKSDIQKAEDEKISNFITQLIDDGTPEKDMRLLTQMLLTADIIGAVRTVNFIAKYFADLIKGKTAEEIRKQFAVRNVQ